MKKLASAIFILLLPICSCFWGQAAATYTPDFTIQSKAVFLMNLDTGDVLTEKNPDDQLPPASVTKIMTAILAYENTTDLEELVTYPTYVQDYLYLYQLEHGAISLGGMSAGEELTMTDLLYALLLPSGNDAAMIIADKVGGSQENFVAMMNKRAKELGATKTNFVNANGLYDERHLTTARDMALIAKHFYEIPELMDIACSLTYDTGPTNKRDNLPWQSTNLMMSASNSYYYPGLRGIKTGTLPESGRCFVSSCARDGFNYLCVVLGGPYIDENTGEAMPNNTAFEDTASLYDWVFKSFKVKTLIEKGKYVAEVPLRLSSETDHIRVMTADRFTALVHTSVDASSVTQVLDIPESLDAPIKMGVEIGEMRLMLSGEELGRVALLTADSVEASPLLVLWERIKEITRSFWFKFTVTFIILLIVLYIVLMIVRNRNRRRQSYKPRRRI